MADYAMTIDGVAVPGTSSFDVLDPATNDVLGQAPECSREQLDEAMSAAANAFPVWSVDATGRGRALEAAADLLDAAVDELAPLLTGEQGKPLADARTELRGGAARLRYASTLRLEPEVLQDDEQAYAELVRRPYGTVAAIAPWNAPVIIAMAKVGPALAAGNTVVLKPSPYTPLTTLRVGELLQEVLPAGVLSVISGSSGELGQAMIEHRVPRMVDFTGSVRTGKAVAAAAAPDLKRVTLELGGNDPAIVLDDADPGEIAEQLFWGAFANCGQVCVAIKRLYVPRASYDGFVDALASVASAVKVGPGLEEGVTMGPLNNVPQLRHVEQLVDDALRHGAVAASGGGRMQGPGNFFAPTVLAGVADGTAIVDDEQFGPALPVIPYDSLDEALARANATHFGLGGSVWAKDVERASDVAGRLACGTAWVNSHRVLASHLPFTGHKWSGYGGNSGIEGFHEFTEGQVVWRKR
ncbi:MAG TPA: aldehyde dehydrogenase family protein [Acidimicrobiales bacterium]|nr:aldehyde dehydrogenase family protein [Acidimicrobiales bacterium]